MDVGVVEARHHAPAAQIDHLRPWADPLLNHGVAAHSHNARADTGHGLGLRHGEISRPDLAMNQNERGGGLGVERESEYREERGESHDSPCYNPRGRDWATR